MVSVSYNAEIFAHNGTALPHKVVIEQDDLISIGTIGLLKGINTFKPDKKVKLATYAARCSEGYVRYAPMYIHSSRLIAPRRLLEAQLFNQQYQNYEDIPNVPDRLR